MLLHRFWLICMERKQKKKHFLKKNIEKKKKSKIGELKCTNFPFSILEQISKFKACKSERIDVKGMMCLYFCNTVYVNTL